MKAKAKKKASPNWTFHRHLPDFECFDKITLEVEPRRKTSGLTGDEWLTSVGVSWWFKGKKIHTEHFLDMRFALLMIGAAHVNLCESTPFVGSMERYCDQPGCPELATVRYELKKTFSRQGEEIVEESDTFTYYRVFCSKHKMRGDSSLEDSDENYYVRKPARKMGQKK